MNESDEVLRSESGYQSVVAVYIILFISKDFHPEILKLFEENFHNSVSLTLVWIVIIIFEIHLPSIHIRKSSSDKPLWRLLNFLRFTWALIRIITVC